MSAALGVGLVVAGLVVWLALNLRRARRLLHHLRADGNGLHVGPGELIPWRDVTEIRVETNDQGPFLEDWFLVVCARGRRPVRIPEPLAPAVTAALVELPGFDEERFLASFGSVDNASFVCWRGFDSSGPEGG